MDERSLDDLGMLLVGWCGALALFGYGQAGVWPRRRLSAIFLGIALLFLAHLMDGDRRRVKPLHLAIEED